MNISKALRQRLDAGIITKLDLAHILGISRVTLDTRLEKDNWKKGEKALIKEIP